MSESSAERRRETGARRKRALSRKTGESVCGVYKRTEIKTVILSYHQKRTVFVFKFGAFFIVYTFAIFLLRHTHLPQAVAHPILHHKADRLIVLIDRAALIADIGFSGGNFAFVRDDLVDIDRTRAVFCHKANAHRHRNMTLVQKGDDINF